MARSGEKVERSFQTRSRKAVTRHSRIPGYHVRLPFVFPYFRNVSLEESLALSGMLVTAMTEGDGEALWFALTGHPKALDGHVTLWMSPDAAEYLLGADLISEVSQYEMES